MFSRIPKSKLINLNGFLPVNKPAGVCCNKILFSMREDMYFSMNQSGSRIYDMKLRYARSLEPFAEGLLTFVLGWSKERRRNFVYADYKYRATLELGVEREYDCIDGGIIGTASTNHIDIDLIKSTLEQSVTVHHQHKSEFVKKQMPNYESCDNLTSIDIYNLFNLRQEEKAPKVYQKYPLAVTAKEAPCKAIELIDYCEPYLDIEVACQGGFNMRLFCRDLSEKLKTKASLVKMIRLKEGPIQLDDLRVLQVHEVNLEYYYNRMPAIQYPYKKYIKQFDHLFENKPQAFQ